LIADCIAEIQSLINAVTLHNKLYILSLCQICSARHFKIGEIFFKLMSKQKCLYISALTIADYAEKIVL